MRALMLTGDRNMLIPGTDAYKRLELQRSAVEELAVVYWGWGHLWPEVSGTFDVVTTQDPFWRGLVGLYLATRLKAKLNVQVHTDLASTGFIKHILAQIVLRHATSVRVVSEKIREQVERFGIAAPISVLPVFVDLSRFSDLPRAADGTNTILWIGRFEDEKDPFFALQVLQLVRQTIPNARLIMLGKGSLEVSLRKTAEKFSVEFPGWQDPAQYLPQATIVLSTSRYESWGASIVEALAAGVPVVALDIGIAKEAGAIVVPREQLAQTVVETLQSNVRGHLRITLLPREAWARAWRESL